MINVHQFFEDTEGKGRQIEDEILRRIFEKYAPDVLIRKNPNHTYSQFLQLLLFTPRFHDYRNLIWEQLFQLNVNDRNLILRFLNIINNPRIPNQMRKDLIKYFSSSPFLYHYERIKNGFYLETEQGEIVAYKLDKVLNNPSLINLIKTHQFAGICHQAVEYCAKEVPNGFVMTSDIASLFNYPAYHSYFEQGDYVLDIAANTLYPRESFQNYYNPQELVRIPTEELAQEIAKIPQNLDLESQKANNLLKLALLNK